MKKRLLGKTGVTVAELGLGTAFMAAQGQAGVDECVASAMERGVIYIDTAANYGKGKDEEMLGTAFGAPALAIWICRHNRASPCPS